MGSVPRINRLLTTVSRTIKSLKIQKPTIPNRISCVVLSCRCVTSKLLIISNPHHFWWCTNIFYIYDKLSKGVPIVSNQLPYSLKLVKSYPIISNSKAAKGLLVYLEVSCICTAITISQSQSLRQLLYREIIHARPHLTARVFRYLRTLIGKAAIDRGFLQSLTYFSRLSKSVNQPT